MIAVSIASGNTIDRDGHVGIEFDHPVDLIRRSAF
jgi:hypothetical protein